MRRASKQTNRHRRQDQALESTGYIWATTAVYSIVCIYLQFFEGQFQPLTKGLRVRLGGGLALQYVRRAVVLLEGVPKLDLAGAVTLS